MKADVALLGDPCGGYTRTVAAALESRAIRYYLVWCPGVRPEAASGGVFARFVALRHSPEFRALSPRRPFFWFKAVEQHLYRRSADAARLGAAGLVRPRPVAEVAVGDFATEASGRRLAELGVRLAVLGDVPILRRPFLDAFGGDCLNAHPAPLPEVRGGGSVYFTLARGLRPAVSVHIVSEEVDAGEILDVVPLRVRPRESIPSLSLRLGVSGADALADVVRRIIDGEQVPRRRNVGGTLHRWKECTEPVQRRARRALWRLAADSR